MPLRLEWKYRIIFLSFQGLNKYNHCHRIHSRGLTKPNQLQNHTRTHTRTRTRARAHTHTHTHTKFPSLSPSSLSLPLCIIHHLCTVTAWRAGKDNISVSMCLLCSDTEFFSSLFYFSLLPHYHVLLKRDSLYESYIHKIHHKNKLQWSEK